MTGLIAPDERTFEYLRGRDFAPEGATWDHAVASWRELSSDVGAHFDMDIEIDVSTLAPMITWGTSPQHAVAIDGVVPEQSASGIGPEAYARALQYARPAPRGRLVARSKGCVGCASDLRAGFDVGQASSRGRRSRQNIRRGGFRMARIRVLDVFFCRR